MEQEYTWNGTSFDFQKELLENPYKELFIMGEGRLRLGLT